VVKESSFNNPSISYQESSPKHRSLRWRIAQRLERLWWRRYLRNKRPEAYLNEKKAYWQRVLAELDWHPVPGRRVLDAGCGPAGIFIHLHQTEHVTALDPLLDRYAAELEVFDQAAYPEVTFLQQPLEQPMEMQAFSAIYCFNAINHVADWALALDNLTAVAAPGCRMILTSDVHRHRWLEPVFRTLPGDVLHPQQHNAADYRKALSDRGWEIDREVRLRRESIFAYVAWVVSMPK